MKKKIEAFILAAAVLVLFTGCAGDYATGSGKTQVVVFAAASLTSAMEELEASFEKEHPDVDMVLNMDSSGTLMTQIQEGAPCDIFFSAAEKQMDLLESEGFLAEGTRRDVLGNLLVVVAGKGNGTRVTGLEDLAKAKNIALADGSVPAGRYARQALVNLGLLPGGRDASDITAREVSDALGGVEISGQGNVSKVLTAVEEGSCEVGAVYRSDTAGHEDRIEILQVVSSDLTGPIRYPVSQVRNEEADDSRRAAAEKVFIWITGNAAVPVYRKYGFETNVK